LKPRGIHRLQLSYGKLLSSFTFKCNSRRYKKAVAYSHAEDAAAEVAVAEGEGISALRQRCGELEAAVAAGAEAESEEVGALRQRCDELTTAAAAAGDASGHLEAAAASASAAVESKIVGTRNLLSCHAIQHMLKRVS